MMEQRNIQIVRNAYEAFGRGDIDTVIYSTSEDVQWTFPGEGYVPFGGAYHGHDGIRRFFQLLMETSETEDFQPKEFIAQGDRVITIGSARGRFKATGQTYSVDWAMAFTVTNGKISKFYEYTDTAVLAAAYGLARAA